MMSIFKLQYKDVSQNNEEDEQSAKLQRSRHPHEITKFEDCKERLHLRNHLNCQTLTE